MKNEQSEEIWLRSAVTGGLWASMEIIIGSFLHNTRLPFAGSVLAFSGTILLLGFYTIWPYKGLIWRAGLITAIMKSISPSAIILGPMTGIMLEALLIEFVLRIGGKNIIAYMISGIFSISSALLHKVISLLIVYGFNLIKIYVNIINFGLKQTGIGEATAWEIFWVLLGFYLIAGIFAGWLGNKTGMIALKTQKVTSGFSMNPGVKSDDFFEIKKGQKTYMWLVPFHLLVIIAGLFLLNYTMKTAGIAFMILYIIVAALRYGYSMRRLKKPVFWSQLFVIVLLSAFFSEKDNLLRFSMSGFESGLEMMLRALFIIVGFTALSVELRNKKVRDYLYKTGFGRFYRAVSTSFAALPVMIGLLPASKEIIRHPLKSLLLPLVMADRWLEIFKTQSESQSFPTKSKR